MIEKKTIKGLAVLLSAGLLIVGLASAGDKELVIDDSDPKGCLEEPCICEIFDKNTLYENENACFVKKVHWVFRYHGQFHNTSLDHDRSNTAWGTRYWESRRFRPGIKVTFANDWQFYTEWNVGYAQGTQEALQGDFFDNAHNLGLKGKIGEVTVDIGKHKAKNGIEWAMTSNKIHTIERSLISQETLAFNGHPNGITFGADALGGFHELGIWGSGSDDFENGGGDDHLFNDDVRAALTYRTNYDLSERTVLHFSYMFVNNDDGTVDAAGDGGRLEVSPYNDMATLGTVTTWDLGLCDRKASLILEVLGGRDRQAQGGNNFFLGNGENDAAAGEDTWGFVALPTYDLTERLQLVGRYSYASFARTGRPQRRAFEQDARGGELNDRPNLEDVHTFYIGLNYKLCGDNLKVMTGYEYLTGDLYTSPASGLGDIGKLSGDNLMIAVRTYF